MKKKKLSYVFTDEEKEILEKADFIRFKVFLYEFGKTLGSEIILLDNDTVNIDGEILNADQFEEYLNKITFETGIGVNDFKLDGYLEDEETDGFDADYDEDGFRKDGPVKYDA